MVLYRQTREMFASQEEVGETIHEKDERCFLRISKGESLNR